MKLYITCIYVSLSFFISCNGQINNKSQITKEGIPHLTIGDTVKNLSNSIWIIFQAQNGDYWFGSDTNGIFRFDGKTIVNFTERDGLSSNRIRNIQEDKHGNIYFSTLAGIDKFNGSSFTYLKPIKNMFPNSNWKLQSDDLWFSIIGKNGEKGPYRFDGENLYQLEFPKHFMEDDYFKRFPNNAWSPYEVYFIYKDQKGNMWFGTSNFGLCRYDGYTLSWMYEDHLTNVPNGGSFGIRSIIEDLHGSFWICNSQHRYTMTPDFVEENGNRFIKYHKEKGIDNLKSADGFNYIYFMSAVVDSSNNLWLATYDDGVWKYNGKSTTRYEVKEGPKDYTVFSIYKDKKGNLWLGTHAGGAFKFNGLSFERFKP